MPVSVNTKHPRKRKGRLHADTKQKVIRVPAYIAAPRKGEFYRDGKIVTRSGKEEVHNEA